MKLWLYIFASLTLMAIFAAMAYAVNSDNFTIEFLGINFNLPIALWMILPMIVLFIFTLAHMFFHGLKNYMQVKKWKKDTLTLEDALYWSLVNEPKEQKYALGDLGSSALLLSKAKIDVSDNVEGLTPRLSRVVNIIRKIKSGEYVDLKEEKMVKVFNPGNPILAKNRMNCLESDDNFVEGVMKSSTGYSKIVQETALEVFAKKQNFDKARKYIKVFDVKNFLTMLKRVNNDDNLGLTVEIVSEFVDVLKLKCSDFIEIAVITKKHFKPEENLLMFRSFQVNDEKAQNAYLYLLFEYELLDQVNTYLSEHDEDDFVKFRALLTLKQEHNRYKLDDIVDIKSICNEAKLYS
jgi:uncharacterized integral membrane protein